MGPGIFLGEIRLLITENIGDPMYLVFHYRSSERNQPVLVKSQCSLMPPKGLSMWSRIIASSRLEVNRR